MAPYSINIISGNSGVLIELMKKHFISITFILFIFYSCATSKQCVPTDNGFIIFGTYQHWFESVPGESEITERGVDIILNLKDDVSIPDPLHLIFDKRKSFYFSLTRPEDGDSANTIEATILLESSLFNEISERIQLSDRLVYRDGDGNLRYEKLEDLQRLPDRYEN